MHLSFKNVCNKDHKEVICYMTYKVLYITAKMRKHSGSVVTRDRGAAVSSLTALGPWATHINPSFVLVQPRKTLPYITVRLLMGGKESNQTNKTAKMIFTQSVS